MKNKSIFSQESLENISTPEKLDDYIQVARPRIWIVIAALLVAVAAFLVWGFVGTLPQTLPVRAMAISEQTAVGYVPVQVATEQMLGCPASLSLPDGSNISGTVVEVSNTPLSYEEIAAEVNSSWFLDSLVQADYSYAIKIALADSSHSLSPNTLLQSTLTLAEIKPIEMVFK